MIEITVKAEHKERKAEVYANRLRACVNMYETPFANTERVANELQDIVKEQEEKDASRKDTIQALANSVSGESGINSLLSSDMIFYVFTGILCVGLIGAEFLPALVRWAAFIAAVLLAGFLFGMGRKHRKKCYADRFILNMLEQWKEKE